ncbi:hypothetical protein BpHYR1_036679 [Brachionus plicatilis]|uniref:Uncharacterized protein n=1 Tax=Brachionus plicatilis TaxID=10195 RepID=A0A3M7QKQ3_BRAPC|nr:hypothetical protein BpHYR1_036679 [Brachionus plicatilis]
MWSGQCINAIKALIYTTIRKNLREIKIIFINFKQKKKKQNKFVNFTSFKAMIFPFKKKNCHHSNRLQQALVYQFTASTCKQKNNICTNIYLRLVILIKRIFIIRNPSSRIPIRSKFEFKY